MKINRINENVIRVEISNDEIAEHGLSVLDFIKRTDKVRDFLMGIAKEVYGKNDDNDEEKHEEDLVSFEVMPSSAGLAIRIVRSPLNRDMDEDNSADDESSFVEDDDDEEESEADSHSGCYYRKYHPEEFEDENDEDDEEDDDDDEDSTGMLEDFHRIYSFADFDDLVAFMDVVHVADLASSLYFFEGKYYLQMEFIDDLTLSEPQQIWALANEFGTRFVNDKFAMVKHYGICIYRRDAISQFKENFFAK
ncbi:MAG: adaptor protein MecA [Lactobacillus iners]|nr:adaptor protein MecA [Lactobacillus iners]